MSILTKPYFQARKNNGVLYEPDSSCVLWLPGQDDPQSSTIRDRSGNGNNGTIVATWVRESSGLWVLSFDGTNDKIDCGDDSSVQLTSDFTVLQWLKPTTGSSMVCLNKESGQTDDRGWYSLVLDSRKVRMYGTKAGSTDHSMFFDTTATVTSGVWVFMAGVWDSTNIEWKIYLNGVNQAGTESETGTMTGAIFNSAANLQFGERDVADDLDYSGSAALLRLVSRILGAPEILGHFNQERHLFGR